MENAELVFVPLGGVGEIGMNLALYGYGPEDDREWIMVDCGVTFPGPNLPGVDLILPDITFAQELGDALKAIVITHAHEDHYGALIALWPLLRKRIWATPFTAGMLEAKLQSDRIDEDIPVEVYRAGDRFTAGPFEIEAVHVTHSIPEPVSLAMKCPLGKVIHTGDWKIDPDPTLGADTDAASFQRLGKEGVLAIICDSTNAMREGMSPTETEVSASIAKVIEKARGRVAVTTFSSNVGRIRSIAQAAESVGRRVMLMGRSIKRVSEVADDLGYLDGLQPFLDEDEFSMVDRNKLVIICTGSQGEERAAMGKLARDDHPRVHLSAGDTVIYSSRVIPGNLKSILDVQNMLADRGIEIINDGDELVHVSGHPRRNELKQMYDWVKPQIAVPVHGEALHLNAHANLAAEVGVPEVAPVRNGDMLRLAPGPAEITGQVTFGRIYKDGNLIGGEEEIGVQERRKLGYAGLVACSVVIDRNGRLADEIDISVYGLPDVTAAGDPFEDVLYDAANGAAESIPPKRRKDPRVVEEAVYKAIRATARYHWGKKPVVTVFVAKV
ncbi:ribonuclease J [Salaquimonas pukyongi]|uniref:ribonuclease J n=1 Tax=Salaquimonas pukyongi TaxID=2712698 RepID=UPI00096B8351|nr:ribonuclease J [Salaquimonas pukyongi]